MAALHAEMEEAADRAEREDRRNRKQQAEQLVAICDAFLDVDVDPAAVFFVERQYDELEDPVAMAHVELEGLIFGFSQGRAELGLFTPCRCCNAPVERTGLYRFSDIGRWLCAEPTPEPVTCWDCRPGPDPAPPAPIPARLSPAEQLVDLIRQIAREEVSRAD